MNDRRYVRNILVFVLIFIMIGCKNTTGPDPVPLEITLSPTHVSHYEGTDGSIDLTVTSGTQPYSYIWSNGAITEDVNNLSPGTYSVEVTDSKGMNIVDSTKINDSIYDTVTDIDGNIYKTVKIGEQWWMAENLMVTHDPDGNPIQSYIYNDDISNVAIYGRLYTWDVVMDSINTPKSQGIAPSGWHIPNTQDWQRLIDFLGGNDLAGGKLKEKGTSHWNTENVGATNSSGFSARGAGEKEGNIYQFKGRIAIYWSSNSTGTQAYYYYLENENTKVTQNLWQKDLGYSVRCIKDNDLPQL